MGKKIGLFPFFEDIKAYYFLSMQVKLKINTNTHHQAIKTPVFLEIIGLSKKR